MTKPWQMARVRSQQRPRKRSVFEPVGDAIALHRKATFDGRSACESCGYLEHAPMCPTQRKAEPTVVHGGSSRGGKTEALRQGGGTMITKQPEARAGWHKNITMSRHPSNHGFERDDGRAAVWSCGAAWESGSPWGGGYDKRGGIGRNDHPTAEDAMAYADAELEDAAQQDRSEPPPGWTVQLERKPIETWYWGRVGNIFGLRFTKRTRAEAVQACWAAADAEIAK